MLLHHDHYRCMQQLQSNKRLIKVQSPIWDPLQASTHLKFNSMYVASMQLCLSNNVPHKSSIQMYLTRNYIHTIFSYSFLVLSASQELEISSFTRVTVHVGCKWVPKEVHVCT